MQGETMIDLGSGAGLDCLLASPRVGEKGRVFGVDLTVSMVSLAERNKGDEGDYENVTFVCSSLSCPPPNSRKKKKECCGF